MRKLIGGNFGFIEDANSANNFFMKNSEKLFPSGRSAFINLVKYIFREKKIKKIEIPSFLCESIASSLHINKIRYSFYSINKKFELKPKLKKDTLTLLVNLFSLNTENINRIALNNKNNNFIIDNTHSILSQNFSLKTRENTEIFFSLRKFSPVVAGMSSIKNVSKITSKKYFKLFKQNVELKKKRYKYFKLETNPIDVSFEKKMVKEFDNHEKKLKNIFFTKIPIIMPKLLNKIKWQNIKKKRRENFIFLSNNIRKKFKILNLNNSNKNIIPMFLLLDLGKHRNKVKSFLFSKRILAPTHWPKLKLIDYRNFKVEKKMTENLLSIPIDQRYNLNHMDFIAKNLLKY